MRLFAWSSVKLLAPATGAALSVAFVAPVLSLASVVAGCEPIVFAIASTLSWCIFSVGKVSVAKVFKEALSPSWA